MHETVYYQTNIPTIRVFFLIEREMSFTISTDLSPLSMCMGYVMHKECLHGNLIELFPLVLDLQ